MARTFQHIEVTFRRTVTQTQAVDVAVPPELAGKQATEFAETVAKARIKDAAWENGTETPAEIVR